MPEYVYPSIPAILSLLFFLTSPKGGVIFRQEVKMKWALFFALSLYTIWFGTFFYVIHACPKVCISEP